VLKYLKRRKKRKSLESFSLKSKVSSEIASKLSAIGRSVNVMDILIAGIATVKTP